MRRILVLESVDSTNTYLKKSAAAGERELCVIAHSQTGGRGRLGRSFESPAGAGLYMSFIHVPQEKDELDSVTARAAVATARAVERLCRIPVGIKWVNDLFVNEKKLCGILTEGEMSPDSAVPKYLVIGIGLNLKKAALPDALSHIATSVEAEGGVMPDTEELALAILAEFDGAADFVTEYRDRQIFKNCPVTVHRGGESFPATALEVDGSCAMVLRLEDGRLIHLNSGEISLRRAGGSS